MDTYQPLDTCTRNSFRLMCKSLNSRADVTLGKDRVMDILMRMEADVQATLKIMVKDIHSIAITCDGWTSKANESYTAVTGHYIDSRMWTLEKIIFGCFSKEGKSTASDYVREIKVKISFGICYIINYYIRIIM